MEALGLKDISKPESSEAGSPVSLGSLAELTGFPVDYIKRELLLSGGEDISIEDLRKKVLAYLNTSF
ncbi:MAG: hypothetical protein K2Q18_14110 [Bdellovibrionales bacterium]|nr:hypothetical protein [Bdellovibrionales bacterium]